MTGLLLIIALGIFAYGVSLLGNTSWEWEAPYKITKELSDKVKKRLARKP